MENKSLYLIQEEYTSLASQIEENEGEITPELEELLKINEEELIVKSDNYCKLIKTIDSRNNSIDEEIKRLQSLKKIRTTLINNLKYNLLNAVLLYGQEDKNGVKKIELDLFKLSTRKNPKIEITSPESIDVKYTNGSIIIKNIDEDILQNIKKELNETFNVDLNITREISKTKIKEAIILGQEVSGAIYNKENYSLTIK